MAEEELEEQPKNNRKIPTLLSLRDVVNIVGSMAAITVAIITFSNQMAITSHNVDIQGDDIEAIQYHVEQITSRLTTLEAQVVTSADLDEKKIQVYHSEHSRFHRQIKELQELGFRLDERLKIIERRAN